MAISPKRNSQFSALMVFVLIWLMSALAFTGLSLLSGMLFFGKDLVSSGLDAIEMEGGLSWLRYNQFLNQLGIFILPSFIFAVVIHGRKGFLQGVGMAERSPWISWAAGLLLMISSVPLVNIVLEWNAGLDLPASLQGLEDWIQRQEDSANAVSGAFLETRTPADLILNVILIALIPAFGEELLFRATLQPLFIRWTRNHHVGILISAFAFSALHFQFFGFLPRLLLGFILGYAFYWTRNLWIPVAMHLLNNLTIVLYFWLNESSSMDAQPETLSGFNPVWAIIIGLVLMFVSASVLRSQSLDRQKEA